MKPKLRCCYCQNAAEEVASYLFWCEDCQEWLSKSEVEVSEDEVDTVSFYRKHVKKEGQDERE